MDVIKKTTLYYFTGTGNSLLAAKEIATKLGECKLISIGSLKDKDHISCDTTNLGLIFPLYFEGLPALVLDFIDKVDLKKVGYIFTVITRGTPVGSGGIYQLKKLLKLKSSRLDSGFYLNMPWNYIIALPPPSPKKQKLLISKAKNKIIRIVDSIKDQKKVFDYDPMFYMNPIVSKSFIKKVNMLDIKFNVTDKCNSCGICEKYCPVSNIMIINEKPVWQNDCEQCLGCLNICPENAIKYGNKTFKNKYFNPEIKINESCKN